MAFQRPLFVFQEFTLDEQLERLRDDITACHGGPESSRDPDRADRERDFFPGPSGHLPSDDLAGVPEPSEASRVSARSAPSCPAPERRSDRRSGAPYLPDAA